MKTKQKKRTLSKKIVACRGGLITFFTPKPEKFINVNPFSNADRQTTNSERRAA